MIQKDGMLHHLSLALVREPASYKRALLLAEAAHQEGRVEDAERLIGVVYDIMDALDWSLGGEVVQDNLPPYATLITPFSRA